MARLPLALAPTIAAFLVLGCSNAPEAAAPQPSQARASRAAPVEKAKLAEEADTSPEKAAFTPIKLACSEFDNFAALAHSFLRVTTTPEDRGFNVRIIAPSESTSHEGAVAWPSAKDGVDLDGKAPWVACSIPRDVRGTQKDFGYSAHREGTSRLIELTLLHEEPLQRTEVFAVIDTSLRSVVFAAGRDAEVYARPDDHSSVVCKMRRDVQLTPKGHVRVKSWNGGETPPCPDLLSAYPKLVVGEGLWRLDPTASARN